MGFTREGKKRYRLPVIFRRMVAGSPAKNIAVQMLAILSRASFPSGTCAGKDLPAVEHPFPELGLDRDTGPAGPVHELPDIGEEEFVGPHLDIEPGETGKAGMDRGCNRIRRVVARRGRRSGWPGGGPGSSSPGPRSWSRIRRGSDISTIGDMQTAARGGAGSVPQGFRRRSRTRFPPDDIPTGRMW